MAGELDPTLKAISDTRQSVYGSWKPNMAATSENMSGLYRQWQANNPGKPLPSWWAPLMQVAVKLNRVASGRFHQDNFDDARVYLSFVEQLQREEAACVTGTATDQASTTTSTTSETAHER